MATPKKAAKTESITVTPPNFQEVELLIEGTAPLVIARFSAKSAMMDAMAEGKSASSKKNRAARNYEAEVDAARYYDDNDRWEGFNAAAMRCAMISVCRLVNFKMTLAKMAVFVEADGHSEEEGTPLVRIFGESKMCSFHARNANGGTDIRVRPMYKKWASKLRIRFDADQFKAEDVVNLVARVGLQNGLGEGRPNSKSSTGLGWGMFRIVPSEQTHEVIETYGMEPMTA